MDHFDNIASLLAGQQPDIPVYALHPQSAKRAAADFVAQFPGHVLYAVKANPHPAILRALYEGGIRHFDVASLNEAQLIRSLLPDTTPYFMHPVKSVTALKEAAHKLGITHFVVDHADELEKIIALTKPVKPTIIIRLNTPKGMAVYDLGGKFGCAVAEAVALTQTVLFYGLSVGYSFHVGSQCLDPTAYARAIALVGNVIAATGIEPRVIDIGGGFPAPYLHTSLPPLHDYFDVIKTAIKGLNLKTTPRLLCEPGRALAAPASSHIVKVELRRGNKLYLNDGIYGGLSELRFPGLDLPMRVWRMGATPTLLTTPIEDFRFCGPTCDSADMLDGPFALPGTVAAGDYIEMGLAGAYSQSLRTDFNGFQECLTVSVGEN